MKNNKISMMNSQPGNTHTTLQYKHVPPNAMYMFVHVNINSDITLIKINNADDFPAFKK